MSVAGDILQSDLLTAPKILGKCDEEVNANRVDISNQRIIVGLIDTIARYRSTQKLECKLNLLLS